MRKSQAALEFLTTYAWAFIVILITISALYYFGVFDFGNYLPQKCLFPDQLKCLDFSLQPSLLKIKLSNNLGEDICIKSVKITNDANPPLTCTFDSSSYPQGTCAASEFQWIHSTEEDLQFNSCTGGAYLANERVELKITIDYYSQNTPSKPIHSINGKVNGRVTS